jgi:hypothetical protein
VRRRKLANAMEPLECKAGMLTDLLAFWTPTARESSLD